MNKVFKNIVKAQIQSVLQKYNSVKLIENPTLKGNSRESFLLDLIRPYLHPSFSICSGIVVDSFNNQSKQIDIIIYDKSIIPPVVLDKLSNAVPYESVLATIEVKSYLDGEKLKTAVINARSIKLLKPYFAEMDKKNDIKKSPICFLFSFNSKLRAGTEVEKLNEIVNLENKVNNKIHPIFIPLSGICIAEKNYYVCSKAQMHPEFNQIKEKR